MNKKCVFTLYVLLIMILIWATQCYGNEYSIRVDAVAHQRFGLYYPATYKFRIPSREYGLTSQFRYSSEDTWQSLPEKTTTDIFNGIDAVRFDYGGGWAYISISFVNSSENIYLRILDKSGQPITITFDSIPKYYDARNAAVTISLADWSQWDDDYIAACDILGSYGLYFTVGLVTNSLHWNIIQQEIDKYYNQMEVNSHGANHCCSEAEYIADGYQAEIIGSRDSIRNNLSFRGHPYVPLFEEPCGYSDATVVSLVTAGDYLLTREAGNDLYYGSTFIEWDQVQERYGRAHLVFGDGGYSDSVELLNDANSLFDKAFAAGGIYHLADHPWQGFWHEGSYLLQHLSHIKGRNNVWYAPFGQMYEYHFLQERRGNLDIRAIETTSPVANFTASPLTGASPLSVNFTDSSTGSITNWSWDFGDSATSTLQNPAHSYLNTGAYTVTLTVTGPGGSNSKTQAGYIVVNPPAPVANFTASPLTGVAPLSVSFADTSTGSITSWFWNFGDSITSSLRNPVHSYASAGSYTVTLTVTGPGGSNSKSQTGYIVVNPPAPVASFSAAPRTGVSPLSVSFTDSSTGPITNWSWDFGDSATSTLQSPVHSYLNTGSYTVTLTVTGPGGSNSKVQAGYIAVNPPAPVANFTASPLTGVAPLPVNFTDSSTGSITKWLWNFGDSVTSSLQNPVHSYSKNGTYTVNLTVTGPGGSNTMSRRRYIEVRKK